MGVSGRPRPERAEAPNLRQHGARRELSYLSNTVHVQYERAVTVPCHSSSKNSYRCPTNPVCLSTYTSSHLSGVATRIVLAAQQFQVPNSTAAHDPRATCEAHSRRVRTPTESSSARSLKRKSGMQLFPFRITSESCRARKEDQGRAREVALGSGSGHAGPRCR